MCDCGKTATVHRRDLKSGHVKSCGCARYGYTDPQDFIGKRFGELIVEEIIHGNSHIECKCVCSCGNQTITTLSQLRMGKVVSCGCHKRKMASDRMKKYAIERSRIHPGDRFGRLIAVKRDNSNNFDRYGHSKWLCRCDCGIICSVRTGHLLDGSTKSCGCLSHEQWEKQTMKAAQSSNPTYIRRKQYEKVNGELHKDIYILSLDGDISNLSNDNLMAVHRLTYNNLVRKQLLGKGEITRTAVLVDELERKIRNVDS